MKHLFLTLLLSSSMPLLAADAFRIEIRVLELAGSSSAPTEFPAADAAQNSSSLIVKVGEPGRIAYGQTFKLRDVTSDATIDIPLGVSLQVTPVLRGAQLAYRAQVTHSAPVFSTRASMPFSAAEITTRTYHQSGPCEVGKPVWFNYINPENSKTMYIALRLTKESA